MIDVLKPYPIMSNDTNREKKILNVLSYYSRQHSYSTVSNDTNRQKKILSVNALSYYHHIAFNVEILHHENIYSPFVKTACYSSRNGFNHVQLCTMKLWFEYIPIVKTCFVKKHLYSRVIYILNTK